VTEPRLTRITLVAAQRPGAARPQPLPLGGLAAAQPGQPARRLAAAALVMPPEPPADPAARTAAWPRLRPLPAVVRGYGPAGPGLADYLAGRARAWDQIGRPGAAQLSLTAWPRGTGPGDDGAPPLPGQVLLDRGDLRLAVGWTAP
jgi:hypothetical protein